MTIEEAHKIIDAFERIEPREGLIMGRRYGKTIYVKDMLDNYLEAKELIMKHEVRE